ncbi:alpha/beta hydrolase [Thiomicrorhabdus sp. Kp2]|uniref:alpha/beta hydrolase n=1 Tax=Thiomicrorhabdus sp. Kp2 TaxID=1123518 RepID=UPI00040E87A7|nr:alpha/beta fold hydrolase [Thiomicrorhabdus sp. Kp2]
MDSVNTKRSILIPLIFITILLSFAIESQAATVSHKLNNSEIHAEADYFKGETTKPAVLIIHGFLTTNKFHTVVAMSKSLQDEGFTTLAPTLTLGINKRQNSIKCNSIHTHTLETDVDEIQSWVDWLMSQGHQKIILVGHSSGSQELLEYLNTKPQTNITGAVFTSLFYLKGKELGTLENEIVLAKDLLSKNQNRPNKYSFLFCKNNYFATTESYLSYMKLDREYVLNSLNRLQIPSYTIMGSADKRYLSVGKNWLDEIKHTGTNLIIVDGANHFFSSEHEFDLQDRLVEIVKEISSK